MTTQKQKLECMIGHLIQSHLDIHGGYPYDYEWFGDILVVAGLDDFKERHRTEILKYKKQALLDWYDRAVKLNAKDRANFPDLRSALFETERA